MIEHPLQPHADGLRSRVEAFRAEHRIAFAAYWAQVLVPAYEALHRLVGFGEPTIVQSCLDLVWKRALGDTVDTVRCQGQLLTLAPEIEVRPVLGYAAMECTAAVWDALAASDDPTVDRCLATWAAFGSVVEHFLMNRDHRGALISGTHRDPFGLRGDPIWEPALTSLDDVLEILEGTSQIGVVQADTLKAKATFDLSPIIDSMVKLSLALQPAG